MKSVRSPSDLARTPSKRNFLVGGRVIRVQPTELVLADALATITLVHPSPLALKPGDLVVARVCRQNDGTIELLGLENHDKAPEPTGYGEFSRLFGEGRARRLEARSRAKLLIRSYFEEHKFLEVDTPTFVPCPGLDPHVHSLASVVRGERVDHLITSPELHMKRLITGGLPRVYQFARCFRAEELGSHHEPEFTLLEWYRAFAGYDSMLEDTENIVRRVFEGISHDGSYQTGNQRGSVHRAFQRFTIREAFREFANCADGVALAAENEDEYFRLLVDEVEPALARLETPVFLTHYPLSQAALARRCPNDPTVAERFELYIGSVEVSNGFGELTCAATQRSRFEAELDRRAAEGEPTYPIDEKFLNALEEGMPLCSGNALGLDRLVALASGADSISQVFAFSDLER